MRKITLLLALLTTSTFLLANRAYRDSYIEKYKDLAISEMHRTGIPASIKLAQAILESNAGQSTLAREANNHFGIKCGSQWSGKKFYRKDDDRNKRGKLIKSCFRSFKSAEDSFIEHSDFLSVQNRKRYDFLFDYGSSDYTSWAYGLKKAGYATHKQYPQLLIKLIDEFQLYKYDNPGGFEEVVAVRQPIYHAPTKINTAPKQKRKRNQPNIFDEGSAGEISMDAFKTKVATTNTINNVAMTFAVEGDDIGKVALRAGVAVRKLVKFNDGIDSYEEKLASGTKIFLAKKKTKFRGKKKFHYVKATDSMESLSQDYGIQIDALYAMNAMPRNSEPAIGEKIRLKGKMPKGRQIKTRMLRMEQADVVLVDNPSVEDASVVTEEQKIEASFSAPKEETIIEVEELNTSEVAESEPVKVEVQWETPEHVEVQKVTTPKVKQTHKVNAGETLWSISQRYSTTVEAIRKLNGLNSNTILVGQELRVK